jgi:hypothetical protein
LIMDFDGLIDLSKKRKQLWLSNQSRLC